MVWWWYGCSSHIKRDINGLCSRPLTFWMDIPIVFAQLASPSTVLYASTTWVQQLQLHCKHQQSAEPKVIGLGSFFGASSPVPLVSASAFKHVGTLRNLQKLASLCMGCNQPLTYIDQTPVIYFLRISKNMFEVYKRIEYFSLPAVHVLGRFGQDKCQQALGLIWAGFRAVFCFKASWQSLFWAQSAQIVVTPHRGLCQDGRSMQCWRNSTWSTRTKLLKTGSACTELRNKKFNRHSADSSRQQPAQRGEFKLQQSCKFSCLNLFLPSSAI